MSKTLMPEVLRMVANAAAHGQYVNRTLRQAAKSIENNVKSVKKKQKEVETLKVQNRRLETSLSEWKALHAKQVSYHLDWEGETAKLLRNSTIKVDQYKARVAELESAFMYVEGGPDSAQEKEDAK